MDADAVAKSRATLDADSPMWRQYAEAMEHDPDVLRQAQLRLGKSREVSKAIVRSAGRPNSKVTAFARFNLVAGTAAAAYAIADMSYEIVDADEGERLYGPGLQAGYQFVSRGGFTVMVSLGLGYAPGVPEGESEVGGMGGLGLGYTWRRQSPSRPAPASGWLRAN